MAGSDDCHCYFSALTIFLQFKFTRERVTEEQMSQGAEEEKTVKTASLKEQLSAVTSEKCGGSLCCSTWASSGAAL